MAKKTRRAPRRLPVRRRNAGRAVGASAARALRPRRVRPRAPSRSRAATRRADKAAVDGARGRARPAAGHALRRPPLQGARRPAGHRHERQGRHDPRRVRRRRARSACAPSAGRRRPRRSARTTILWRIHQQVPAAGEIVIFNRSHYEDVLVPVVKGWINGRGDARSATPRSTTSSACSSRPAPWSSSSCSTSRRTSSALRLQERLDDPTKHWKFARRRPRGAQALGRLPGGLRRRRSPRPARRGRRGRSSRPTRRRTAT